MQLGCVWIGDHIVTLSLSGHLNYLDRNDPATPARIIMVCLSRIIVSLLCQHRHKHLTALLFHQGHSNMILSMAMEGDTLYTADGDGRVCVWDTNSGRCIQVTGKGHQVQIQSVSLSPNQLVTCSIDDTMREIDPDTRSYRYLLTPTFPHYLLLTLSF